MRLTWLLPALLVLGTVLYAVYGGSDDGSEATPPAPPKRTGLESIPLPPLPSEDPEVLARGFYILEGDNFQITLELAAGRRFKLLSILSDGGRREAEGTWMVKGPRLTMAYTRVSGLEHVTPKQPMVLVNGWFGRQVELMDTGMEGRILLEKRTAIRGN